MLLYTNMLIPSSDECHRPPTGLRSNGQSFLRPSMTVVHVNMFRRMEKWFLTVIEAAEQDGFDTPKTTR